MAIEIVFRKKSELDYYRQEPAEKKLYDAFVRAKEQPIPIFVPELDIYNEAYRMCAFLMVETEPEDALERYSIELSKVLGGMQVKDLALVLIWGLLSVQESVSDQAGIFFTHLEAYIQKTPFYKEMKNGVEECRSEGLVLRTDFLSDTNLEKAQREKCRNDALAFMESIRGLVAPEWRDNYRELWRAILNTDEVGLYLFDAGKMGMGFNRKLVLGIARQMMLAGIFNTDNATEIAYGLSFPGISWTDSWRKEILFMPGIRKVEKVVERLISEFSPLK